MSALAAKPDSHLVPAIAVALCGAMWGVFWVPLHWFGSEGVGGAWVSLTFNAMAMLSALPWLMRRAAWQGFADQAVNGLLLGTAFSLYTVSLVLTDVIHAILLFYLTPVWSTLAGRFFLRERLSGSRLFAMFLGFAGLAAVLGVKDGIPLPRNWGDALALISGICWAAGTLRSFHRPTRKVALPVFCFAFGGFLSSGAILAIATGLALPLAEPGHLMDMLPWIMLLGLIIFVPPNFLVLWAAQRIDSARVGILLMTEVLFGTLSAGFLSGQPFGLSEGIGTALIVGAGLIEVLRR
ncbi:MAG: DMT family transporter [Alphaproteobacteria bacterium]|uniref:DMT family transporter n=1 Tax=Aestuariivirga sp. TaxID=2650926 RepID=UPI0030185B49|nr:DMT family transporter [Alphaproteobacteria bacterium]